MNRPTDPRMRPDDSPTMQSGTIEMYKMHIETVEKECSGLFAEYMNLYNQDPNSESTTAALENFNTRYDHLKKLQGVLEPPKEREDSPIRSKEDHVRSKAEPVSVEEQAPLIDPKRLLFLQLQDDSSGVEKRRNQKVYKTTREFCDAFEVMMIDNRLSFGKDWEKTLPMCLNRDDYKWFTKELENRNLQWKDARQLLIDYKLTGMARMYMMMELCNFKQNHTESVRSYAFKYQKLCKEAHIKDGTMLATQFFVSLQDQVQQCIFSALEAGKSMPRTLSDMVQFAVDHDTPAKYPTKRSYGKNSGPPTSKRPRKIEPCTWCGNPFESGHKCKEFYEHKKNAALSSR